MGFVTTYRQILYSYFSLLKYFIYVFPYLFKHLTVNAMVVGSIQTWGNYYVYFHFLVFVDKVQRWVSLLNTQYLKSWAKRRKRSVLVIGFTNLFCFAGKNLKLFLYIILLYSYKNLLYISGLASNFLPNYVTFYVDIRNFTLVRPRFVRETGEPK